MEQEASKLRKEGGRSIESRSEVRACPGERDGVSTAGGTAKAESAHGDTVRLGLGFRGPGCRPPLLATFTPEERQELLGRDGINQLLNPVLPGK